jgi:hypothetical protein
MANRINVQLLRTGRSASLRRLFALCDWGFEFPRACGPPIGMKVRGDHGLGIGFQQRDADAVVDVLLVQEGDGCGEIELASQ